MLLHEVERVQVADALVERGRALEVGEEQREPPDRQALAGDDRLGVEEVEERLVREQLGAGQERLHRHRVVIGRLVILSAYRSSVAFVNSISTGPASMFARKPSLRVPVYSNANLAHLVRARRRRRSAPVRS